MMYKENCVTRMKKRASMFAYLGVLAGLAVSFWFSRSVPQAQALFQQLPEGLYLAIALIFVIGFGTGKVSKYVIIPSFVLAILMGVAFQPFFTVLTGDLQTLSFVNEFLAALILFGSGVEMPWDSFKKYFGPVASLSIFGILISVFFFALIMTGLTHLAGIDIPAPSLLLMGAILAAIEQSAIIPIFNKLSFKNKKIRDIALAEGAVNDVTGAVVTRFFLVASLAATMQTGVLDSFLPLFQREYLDAFALEILWGILVGVMGSQVLKRWYNDEASERDNPALFFAVPVVCFALGGLIGGSGYLAAFVAGLLYQTTAKTKHVAHFYESFNSYLVIPVIFVLLGAIVPIDSLLKTTWIGIAAALVFMIIIRPLVVFSSLIPWMFGKNRSLKFSDYVFLSVMRETGGMSAVLLLIVASQDVPGMEYIFGIGFWVIFLTLLIEPPLIPWVTKKFKIATPLKEA